MIKTTTVIMSAMVALTAETNTIDHEAILSGEKSGNHNCTIISYDSEYIGEYEIAEKLIVCVFGPGVRND